MGAGGASALAPGTEGSTGEEGWESVERREVSARHFLGQTVFQTVMARRARLRTNLSLSGQQGRWKKYSTVLRWPRIMYFNRYPHQGTIPP